MPLPARSGIQSVTPEWLLTTVSSLPKSYDVPEVFWLDDHGRLLVALPPVGSQRATRLEVLDANTGARTSLGEGKAPVPSPDGRWVAFTRSVNDTAELWVMQSDGEDAHSLMRVPGGLTGFAGYNYSYAWAPNAQQLALAYQPYVPSWKREERPLTTDSTQSTAVDGDQIMRPPQNAEIFVIDRQTGSWRSVASIPAGVRQLSWFPDGAELLFAAERVGLYYNASDDEELIRAVRVSDGRLRTIVALEGLQQHLAPKVSPNGRSVVFVYDPDNPVFDILPSIAVAPATTTANTSAPGCITRLTREARFFQPRWAPNGRRIYASREYGAYTQLYTIDGKTGALKQITRDPLSVRSYAISPDGSRLAWVAQDAHARWVIRVAMSDGRAGRDVLVLPTAPPDMALSEVREVEWAVADYPERMRGILILPLEYRPKVRYPLIVDIHGGGPGASVVLSGGLFVSTPLEWQLWAAKGYAVFVPEFRSSGAFGQLAVTRELRQQHDAIGADIRDVMAGADTLIAVGLVDSTRIAVIGHSAGARRANWLAVATHRFRAVVSNEGWADDFLLAGLYPTGRVTTIYQGTPVEVPENYMKNSPIFHARGATTPTLFVMGDPNHGGADRIGTVRWLYNALRAQGVETQYVTYAGEGHVLARPANLRDMLTRVVCWIDGHIGPASSSAASHSCTEGRLPAR